MDVIVPVVSKVRSEIAPTVTRLTRQEIESRLKVCNPLPSLTSTNRSLCQILHVEHRYTTQISDIIRHDPSLSARVLQLVNSAYFGLARPVRSIPEAVFYLGLEQVRQLALITPVIDDLKQFVGSAPFNWRGFWQHSIGTAILARDVMELAGHTVDETGYLAGLLHDVGKIVMASVFPHHFRDIRQCVAGIMQDLPEVEQFVLGIDHSELGGLYLASHNVPELFVFTARYHHQPEAAPEAGDLIAAVQVADLLLREACIGVSGNPRPVSREDCLGCSGWKKLFGNCQGPTNDHWSEYLTRQVRRLPSVLETLIR